MTDSAKRPVAGGRSRPARYNQGEEYRVDGDAAANRARMRKLYLAGAAMLGVTMVALLLNAPSWLAASLGIAVFVTGAMMARRGAGAQGGRKVKPVAGVDPEKVRRELETAETDLEAIDVKAKELRDQRLDEPIRAMTASVRDVLDYLADDPADMRRARKFLKVYVPSAREAVEKFAEFGVKDEALDARFRELLVEMKQTAERQLETLRLDEKFDLEVEIDVLAERLKQ